MRRAPLGAAALGILLALGACLGACGSPPPAAYTSENEQAAAAKRSGNDLTAAQHYERAILVADSQRDADEARYRAADSYARAGERERAKKLYRELAARPAGERSARADFALADLELRSGDEAAGQAQLAEAIRRNPGSGVARTALTQHLRYLRGQGGTAMTLAYLDAERRRLGQSELAETLEYHYARELDDAGQTARARDAYLSCAARFPYPGGAYWDDALYRAAEKELALAAPERALEHLTRLLAEQESASLNGSYQRSRYAEGQLLIAHIYRDTLHDSARARRELRKVWLNHPTSRLVDDALFEEAQLARDAKDQAGTCAPLRIIATERPDSRYAPCAHLLCAELPALAGRECRAYITRALQLP